MNHFTFSRNFNFEEPNYMFFQHSNETFYIKTAFIFKKSLKIPPTALYLKNRLLYFQNRIFKYIKKYVSL